MKSIPLNLLLLVVLIISSCCSCSGQGVSQNQKNALKIEVIGSHPHDPESFTQGLVYENGELLESAGLYGKSSLRRVEIETGKVLQKISQKEQFFAEGITTVGDKIYQLTWKEHSCFVYDKKTFQWEKTLQYQGEGWGITWNGQHLIVSDGSAQLKFYDPETFKLQKTIQVQDGKKPVKLLNELEYINGEIWANILNSDLIARIDPEHGNVLGWIDCRGFVPDEFKNLKDREQVLNGIAFDEKNQRVFITGKLWPVLYELKIVNGKNDSGK